MGDALGIPDWLAQTIFVVAGLTIWLAVGFVMHRRGRKRLAAKRPNPTRQEFLEMLAGSISEDTANWLWDQAESYYQPLTPHPDDRLSEDAMIDEDDWSMDWPKAFAELHGFSDKAYPDWPKDWAATVRNLGKWLDMGKAAGAFSRKPRGGGRR